MLCGATQHSTTDPFDRNSPGIPIGPHWMIIWPFDAKRCGLPNTVRDAGHAGQQSGGSFRTLNLPFRMSGSAAYAGTRALAFFKRCSMDAEETL
jgi:hypothetical protein